MKSTCKYCEKPGMWRLVSNTVLVCNDHKNNPFPDVTYKGGKVVYFDR